jgi:hypothetical protein
MPDAAKGVRQLVLLHGRATAHEMVEPDAGSLVRIASEVLGDEKGRSGYSYSGLCLTSLPHRKLGDDQAWERTVGPLTLIIEPGRIKIGDEPSRMLGVPHGARARLILIYLQTQAVLTNSREVSLGRSMREWMGRMGLSVGGETASALREQARRIATCSMRFSWQTPEKLGEGASTMVTNERIIKSGLFFHHGARATPGRRRCSMTGSYSTATSSISSAAIPCRCGMPPFSRSRTALRPWISTSGWPTAYIISSAAPRSGGATCTSSSARDTATDGHGSQNSFRRSARPWPLTRRLGSTLRTGASSCTRAHHP